MKIFVNTVSARFYCPTNFYQIHQYNLVNWKSFGALKESNRVDRLTK